MTDLQSRTFSPQITQIDADDVATSQVSLQITRMNTDYIAWIHRNLNPSHIAGHQQAGGQTTNSPPSMTDLQSRTACPQITQIDADDVAWIHCNLYPSQGALRIGREDD